MFSGCRQKYIDHIDRWNVLKVEDMSYMFSGCEYLRYFVVRWYPLIKLKNTSHMFSGCVKLSSCIFTTYTLRIELPGVENISYMFYGCTEFRTDLTKWYLPNLTQWEGAFEGTMVPAMTAESELASYGLASMSGLAMSLEEGGKRSKRKRSKRKRSKRR